MSTSAGKRKAAAKPSKKKVPRAYVPTAALVKSVAFNDAMMTVTLSDGRVLGVPLSWFPRLHKASAKQRQKYEIGGGGISLHWPDLDEDLSIAGLMAGVDWRSA